MEFPMTLQGKKKIDDELEHLIKVEREDLKVEIAEAREHGDLKENAEYHAAKEKQGHIEGRIMELQNKVAKSKVIDVATITSDRIVFGATVKLYNIDEDLSVTYQIVGEDEADTTKNKISLNSPIAKALIGKEEGDEVIGKAPKGNITYEVEGFEYK